MIGWAVEALIASAVLIALVLAIRIPVRRAFGAPVAYALWLLPVLRLVLPPLPATLRDGMVPPIAAPLGDMGRQVSWMILPAAGVDLPAGRDFAALIGGAAVIAWGVGAFGFIAWQCAAYVRFRRRLLAAATPLDTLGGVTIVSSPAAAGPLAFGIVRRFVAFPRDFAGRYDESERELALAHELGHHARGDLIANWIALAVLALHWFNPLAWFAFRAYRADQEMANDARVLAGRSAAERHAYACAIVKAAHGGAIAAACHLHNVDDLKGRLRMLSTPATRARILAGTVSIAALGAAALGITATGTATAAKMRAGVVRATGVDIDAIRPADLLRPPPPLPVPVPAAPGERAHRVVIHRDGETQVYEGADADAYIADHPAPIPPQPPIPPTPDMMRAPPAPPAPPSRAEIDRRVSRALAAAPSVVSRDCGDGGGDARMTMRGSENGHPTVVICTDRIPRADAEGERRARIDARMAAVDTVAIRHQAMAGAIAGLRAARASIAANRNMPEDARRETLAEFDRHIAEMARDEPGKD
ncbi:M56 family metallopeptidase [uncultured Sphingomonas sp.]|uniref:M56 family metallopeptidase n=1 Tax=uncultured Sphingomonas sp. TaxID=158754 RepID=UPI00260FB025|nr:M56 family metallopeptidase [uncultured Sphingomonas sp.]